MLRCNNANQSPVPTIRRATLMSGILAATVVAPAALLAVHAVTMSPVVVNGGASATATVTLDAAAPLTGASILLASSRTSVATVLPKVAIQPRARSGTFTVSTSSGNGGCSLISARVANTNVTQTALISVRPTLALGAVSVSLPDTVVGGGSVQGSVLVASSGGGGPPAAVQLTSSNPTVIVPPSVTPTTTTEAGYLGPFTVQTSLVQPPGTCAIITATHSSGQRRVLLRVMPLVQG